MNSEVIGTDPLQILNWILKLAQEFPGEPWDDEALMTTEVDRLNRLLRRYNRSPITLDDFIRIQINTSQKASGAFEKLKSGQTVPSVERIALDLSICKAEAQLQTSNRWDEYAAYQFAIAREYLDYPPVT